MDPQPMSSPVPLLRPPNAGGSRNNSGMRTPRLGLAIPPSPSQKPVTSINNVPDVPPLAQAQKSSRPAPPQLRLATPTPMTSNATSQEGHALPTGRPAPQPFISSAASGAREGSGCHSRSDSFTMVDDRASGPTSASSSSFSALSYHTGAHRHTNGTPDPASAISSVYSEDRGGLSMEREGSNYVLPDLEKLSLEKGRNLDVEDLDDDGWRAASEQKKIIEVGSLGEGAGGAVTRCILKGGKVEFALKARWPPPPWHRGRLRLTRAADHHDRPKSRCQEADCARAGLQQGVCVGTYLPVLWRVYGRFIGEHLDRDGILRGREPGWRVPGGQKARGKDRRKSPGESGGGRAERADLPAWTKDHSSRQVF